MIVEHSRIDEILEEGQSVQGKSGILRVIDNLRLRDKDKVDVIHGFSPVQ